MLVSFTGGSPAMCSSPVEQSQKTMRPYHPPITNGPFGIMDIQNVRVLNIFALGILVSVLAQRNFLLESEIWSNVR